MPRDDVQLQFLLGSSVRRKKGANKSRGSGNVRNAKGSIKSKSSVHSETLSVPHSPTTQYRSATRTPISLSHASTLEDLKNSSILLNARFSSTPRIRRADSFMRHKQYSPHFLRWPSILSSLARFILNFYFFVNKNGVNFNS